MSFYRASCLSLLLIAGLASAAEKEESEVVSWLKQDKESAAPPTEQTFSLPPLSSLKEWRVYKIGRNMGDTRVEIAADSVSVGSDDIVRYAVAVIPKSGLRNVFFEGLDCYSGRYRSYAWGTVERTWREVEGVKWKVANLKVRNAWQGVLIEDFCAFRGGPLPAKEIVKILRGGPLPEKIN